MVLNGRITGADENYIYIRAPITNISEIIDKRMNACDVILNDGRSISREQRKKAYALMNDIALYTGYSQDEVKELTKYGFIASSGQKMFSLSDVDMTTARLYIDWLIEFCLRFEIPCRDSLLNLCEDIGRYLYLCLIHKKCCICGKPTQLHHVTTVGMGYNRKEIIHIGMLAEPLCWRHHRECHDAGQKSFDCKYHIFGTVIDGIIADKYKLRKSRGERSTE